MERYAGTQRPLHTLLGSMAELLRPAGFVNCDHLECCTQTDLFDLKLAPHIYANILAKMANAGLPILTDGQMQARITTSLSTLVKTRGSEASIEVLFGKKWTALFKNRRIETIGCLLQKTAEWGNIEDWPDDMRLTLQSLRVLR